MNSSSNSVAADMANSIDPRIRRRSFTTNTTANEDQLHHQQQQQQEQQEQQIQLPPMQSMSDYQDGKRFSAEERSSILRDTADVFSNISTKLGFLHFGAAGVGLQRVGRKGEKNGRGGIGNNHHNTSIHSKAQAQANAMNRVRLGVGLYRNFPLAHLTLANSPKRKAAFRKRGHKQMNHVRGTDGWWRTLLVIEDRALDNFLGPWTLVCLNALLACLLVQVWGIELPRETLEHWDTVYSLVLKTSLAFLLVFRLNRCAMRYWEARGLWGNLTHQTRNLVGSLLLYGTHCPKHRDAAIKWGSSFCVSCKNFIRSDHEYCPDELAGFLNPHQITRLRESPHGPLLAASMCRHYLEKVFRVDEHTPAGLAHAYSIRLQECESYVAGMVEQVSGMEKIRSTPLPIAYVAHLRTFLVAYSLFLPYVWVHEWSWATIPLTAFTAFALLGIEGASSEVEIPFSKARPNHLALDAYCLVILESVAGLVVHDANLHMQGRKGGNNYYCNGGGGNGNGIDGNNKTYDKNSSHHYSNSFWMGHANGPSYDSDDDDEYANINSNVNDDKGNGRDNNEAIAIATTTTTTNIVNEDGQNTINATTNDGCNGQDKGENVV